MNPFPYTHDNKRYHTYNYFLKQRYGRKVAKVSLDGGFTCPNRDGNRGVGGCAFCGKEGAGEFAGSRKDTLEDQFVTQARIMRRKWPECAFIPYFQAYTNTYAPLEVLQERFAPFIDREDCVGLAIATRADCLTEDICAWLHDVQKSTDVYLELGLQTIHDETANQLNRGHTYAEFLEGLALARRYDLDVCVHLINGLPGETHDMMMESARAAGQLDIQGLKIHSLFLTRDSALYDTWKAHPFKMMSREDYIALVAEQLRYIPPEIIIERLTGDPPKDTLAVPLWALNKTTILNDIDKLMAKNSWMQGDCLL